MAKIWGRIRETIERHGTAGLLSVVDVAGSVPREAGARIVLQPDGGFFGTIGGGALEYEALASARAVMAAGRGAAQFREWPLGPNLGQCCGGLVRTLTETFAVGDLATVRRFEELERGGPFATASQLGDNGRIVRMLAARESMSSGVDKSGAFKKTGFYEWFGDANTPMLLFGAGHVGRAAVLALAPLPFAVRWIDSRPDQFPRHIPQNVVTVCRDDPVRELAAAPRDALVVVMTHSHPLDFDITAAALKGGPFDFVGLIGSQTKRARFASFARQVGVAEVDIERLICPIGIPEIKGKEPAVIAAALAAQLLVARERVEVRELSPATQPA
jgi:xanthine dehydrogenase accessory factor